MDVAAGAGVNPLLIPEIIKYILEYVGGGGSNNYNSQSRRNGVKQLFKTRLVCRSWNCEAVQLIPPQELKLSTNKLHFDPIREMNLRDVLQNHNKLIPGVSFYCLVIIIDKQQPSNDDDAGPKTDDQQDGVVNRITRFIHETPQQACPTTTKLHIKSHVKLNVGTFWNLIKLIAPNLVELKTMAQISQGAMATLPSSSFSQHDDNEDEVEIVDESFLDNVDFPALEVIKYNFPSTDDPASLNLLITLLNKSSTSLNSLKLIETSTLVEYTRGNDTGLDKLLNETSSDTWNHLTHLELQIHNFNNLFSLFQQSFATLTTLIIYERVLYHLLPVFLDFLRHNCPNVNRLEIILMHNCSIIEDTTVYELRRPILPKIKTLGFYTYEARPPMMLKNFLIMARIFPAVQNYVTNIKTFGYLCDFSIRFGAEPEVQEIIYPNVTRLTIKAAQYMNYSFDEANHSYQGVSSRIWPNLNTLVIEQVEGDDEIRLITPDMVGKYTQGILTKILTLHGITNLELVTKIMNSIEEEEEEDWLSEIFKPNPAIETTKQNLETLTLRLPAFLKQTTHTSEEICIYLNKICGTFPNLQTLYIDEALLRNSSEWSFEQIVEFGELSNKYTNVRFEKLEEEL